MNLGPPSQAGLEKRLNRGGSGCLKSPISWPEWLLRRPIPAARQGRLLQQNRGFPTPILNGWVGCLLNVWFTKPERTAARGPRRWKRGVPSARPRPPRICAGTTSAFAICLKRERQTARRRKTMQEIETTERVIDVRDIAPRHRHAIIFQLFDHLAPESSLQLIADHDPRPLRFQLEAKHGTRCNWSYIEQGPDVWRVRLRHLPERPEADGRTPSR